MPQPRRRWACFPTSIVSDHDNDAAHLYRAMARYIFSIKDEARFYEERANPWLKMMLVNEGASSWLDFQQRYPEIDYTTFDPRRGADLADWLTRVLGTVDIVLVDSSSHEDMIRWVGEMTRPRLSTFLMDPRGELSNESDLVTGVAHYTGICVADHGTGVQLDPARPGQRIVSIRSETFSAGANDGSLHHFDQAASSLVTEITRIVDETLLEANEAH